MNSPFAITILAWKYMALLRPWQLMFLLELGSFGLRYEGPHYCKLRRVLLLS
jgi:hypothetical protein